MNNNNPNPKFDLVQYMKEHPEKRTGGRPKGLKNSTRIEIREKIKLIVDGHSKDINKALMQLKNKDPYKFLAIITRLCELVIPRKSEVAIDNENAIDIEATIKEMKKQLETKNKKEPKQITDGE